jgi:O-antigen/teichoic acid export membrane protein
MILALSIASERLVEIIKGFFPALEKASADENAEARRRSYLQILAVLSGIATALLAQDYIPVELDVTPKWWSIVGLGLLASGGSGFWNSVLTYMANVKDIKTVEAVARKKQASIA